jgi:peptide/nickel transport system permease protein
MTRYIIRRGLQSIFLAWLGTFIYFAVYQLAPGGPLQFLEDNPNATSADANRLARLYGIDRGLVIQYVVWMAGEDWLPYNPTWRSGFCLADANRCSRGILRLDFGKSFHFKGQNVIDLIVERLPATFILNLASFIVGLLGVPLGIYAALNRAKMPDHLIRLSTVLVSTVPEWWIGLLLLLILGGYVNLVPLSGMLTIGDGSLLDRLHHLILPATVSAISAWISYSRILRFEMLEVLNRDYVRMARAKGLSEKVVLFRHVLRNAIMPFVTGIGGILFLALSGSIIFETVFSWPGMGRLLYTAITARDYPLMMASLVINSVLGIVALLMVDILYSVVDPRVRYDVTT